MYTTQDQTAKLIELGFDKPRGLADAEPSSGKWVREAYSIGELIEMLPKQLDNPYKPPLAIEWNALWRVYYGVQEDYSWEWSIWFEEERNELIEALYEMIVKLKEKGVI